MERVRSSVLSHCLTFDLARVDLMVLSQSRDGFWVAT